MAEEDRMMAVQKAAKKAEKDNRRIEREVSGLRDAIDIYNLWTYLIPLSQLYMYFKYSLIME